MRALRLPVLALLVLGPLGCQAGSSVGTMTSRDVVVTARIERLGTSDQFRTDVTIERQHQDGSTQLLAAPSVISQAGQRAEVRIEEDDTRLIAMVHVPGPDDGRETVRVQVTIEESGSLRSPSMRLPVPPPSSGAPEPERAGSEGAEPQGSEPESEPADTADAPG